MYQELHSRRNVITVTATSRPKRIAFLVDPDNEAAESFVDAITDYAIERWGGGYYPIVTTDGSSLTADGWRVLGAVDPDVVCAVSPIDDDLFTEIARVVAPAAIERLDDRARDHLGAWIGGHSLSALNIIYEAPRYLVTAQPWGVPHRFLWLKDAQAADPAVRSFARRNFGLIQETILTQQAFEALPINEVSLETADISTILDSFVQFHGRTTTLHDLSIFSATRAYAPEHDRFTRGFHLVVGDSVRDFIYTWNRALMSEGWGGHDVLWLPTSAADDQALLALVGKWIAREYFNNQDRYGRVLSYSAEEDLLQRVATAVRTTAWMPFSAERLTTERLPFPKTRAGVYGFFRDAPPQRTERIPLVKDVGLVPFPMPYFLTSRRGADDGWMVDLDIEYHLDPARYSNESDSWRLPKRAVLARAFTTTGGLARVVCDGLPSVEVKHGDQHIPLRIPSKRDILYELLQPPHAENIQTPSPKTRFSHFETSEQGRRLAGIIGLFGTLNYAGRTFDDGYWRSVFLQLAGVAENQTRSQVARVDRMLEDAVGKAGFATADDRKTLAHRIAGQLAYFSSPTQSMTADEFRKRFYEVRNRDTEHAVIAEGESYEEFKKREVEAFLEAGILVQGVSLRCPHCGKTGWWVINAISSEIRCDGCLRDFAFPSSPPWRFRLNSLIENGITKVGVLAVLHTLLQMESFARDFFYYLPCQNLYEEYGGDPYTDLDLIVIKDRQVIIGEVKSSPDGFRTVDFDKMEVVTREIRPDRVILAATGADWPLEVSKELEEFKRKVAPLGAAVETLLLPW